MDAQQLHALYGPLHPHLDEKARRLFAGAAVRAYGAGSISLVSRTLGLARNTVLAGLRQLDQAPQATAGHIRAPGGGRKRIADVDPTLKTDLERLVEPTARGDPQSPLRWTCKSTANLARELTARGHRVSARTVAMLLDELHYHLQANRKRHEGGSHPDRDAQFVYINETVKAFQAAGQPVISVDAKKKELVGNFKNAGREWHPAGQPEEVNVYDFLSLGEGRATPFGVYDLLHNEGWVSVGIDHDTSAFAVQSIRRWWEQMGQSAYGAARRLLITADGGGSNGSRTRLWKTELQRFADESGLEISVCHFPPGTSKWNKIEHRLFSFISQNWRGRPLVSYTTLVDLIGATTTTTGLKVKCALDSGSYPAGIKVEDHEMAELNLYRAEFHGEWNYTLKPHKKRSAFSS